MPMNSHEIAAFIIDVALISTAALCGVTLLILGIFGYLKRRR